MRIYVLHFAGDAPLRGALERVMESERVASCTVEPELERLSFLAPEPAGNALVERIYADGGLRWCSRHAFAPVGARAERKAPPPGTAPRR